MRNHHLMIAVFILGVGACSSEQDSGSQDGTVVQEGQALARTPALSAPAPTRLSVGPTVLAAKPVAAPTRISSRQPVTALAGPPDVPPVSVAAAPSPGFADPGQAAAASLNTLAELVGSERPEKRGFGSVPEVKSSTLAGGLPVLFVRLDSLVAHRAGQDTMALLFDKQEMMYPITVAGDVRSSVTVRKRPDGRWEAVKLGDAPVAQSSHSIRRSLMSKRTIDSGNVSLIEIPTVHAYLLGHTEHSVFMVTPLWDIPGTPYTAGVTRTAAEVFSTLQSLAATVDPSVPN